MSTYNAGIGDKDQPTAGPASTEDKIASARAELETTLDAIEDKLNVPKRVGELAEKAKDSYEENPTPWIIGAAAAAVAIVAVIAWAILSDDD